MRKRFVLIFGPPAVGKATVGRELAALTGLRLFHNHMSLEPVMGVFEFGSPPFHRIVRALRCHVFREVAEALEHPGLIFTYVWALDEEGDRAFVEETCAVFREAGADVRLVELYAELDERLRRNRGEERLAAKPSKRDVEASERRLLANEAKHRLNTEEADEALFRAGSHLRIDTTRREALEVAEEIAEWLEAG